MLKQPTTPQCSLNAESHKQGLKTQPLQCSLACQLSKVTFYVYLSNADLPINFPNVALPLNLYNAALPLNISSGFCVSYTLLNNIVSNSFGAKSNTNRA